MSTSKQVGSLIALIVCALAAVRSAPLIYQSLWWFALFAVSIVGIYLVGNFRAWETARAIANKRPR